MFRKAGGGESEGPMGSCWGRMLLQSLRFGDRWSFPERSDSSEDLELERRLEEGESTEDESPSFIGETLSVLSKVSGVVEGLACVALEVGSMALS